MEAWRQYKAFKPPVSQSTAQPKQSTVGTPPTTYTYVAFEPQDVQDPKNWSLAYKSWVIVLLSFLTLSLTFASAASSPAETGMKEEFGCGDVVATAATGLFLLGMGFGAMPTAPLSELYGRLPVYLVTIFLATIFEIACALAPNAPALLVLRFIAGLVSSAPLSNAGGTLTDIGDGVSRTLMFPLFSTCGFVGPVMGPIIGGFLAEHREFGWRWCYWIMAIWNALAFILVGVFMPETLGSGLLKMKAVRFRKVTGETRWRAKAEDESWKEATGRALIRPFKMLAVEPALQFFVLYLLIVYIVLYGSFSAYPYIFRQHGLTLSEIGLTFLPVLVGFIILLLGASVHYRRYVRLSRDADKGVERRGVHQGKIEPEERLFPLMCTCILFPAGLFWLAWTSPPSFSLWVPMMAGLPFGIGLLAIFQGSMQYLIDAYGPFASSALAGSTFIRYGATGLVILAYPKMYQEIGAQWATSIFAILGAMLTPVPFVFYIYGRGVRQRCQFTVRD